MPYWEVKQSISRDPTALSLSKFRTNQEIFSAVSWQGLSSEPEPELRMPSTTQEVGGAQRVPVLVLCNKISSNKTS
jgi:hypothetical protein